MTDGTKNFVKVERGQRIDEPDFQHAIEDTPRDMMGQWVDGVLVGQEPVHNVVQPRTYIVRGFEVTGLSTPPRVQVDRLDDGCALLAFRKGSTVQNGCILTGGDAQRIINISTLADGTYGVYIRFDFREDEFSNRLFWDPNASPPAEFARNVATRFAENWSITVELANPGAEWTHIADVTKAGALITLTVDRRDLYFEGRPDGFYDPGDEWGSLSDRLDARGDHGVFGFRRAIRALQKQVQDILHGSNFVAGADGWFDDITLAPLGQSIRDLISGKLARDGSQTMQGDFDPDGDNTRDMGSSGVRWQDIFAYTLDVATGITLAAGGLISGGAGSTVSVTTVAAGTVSAGTSLDSTANVHLTGIITPTAIAATANNYAPTGIANATIVRLSATGAQAITGINATQASGRVLLLINVDTTDNITLNNEDAGSTAANRFAFGANKVLTPQDGCVIWYDTTSSRWRHVGHALT